MWYYGNNQKYYYTFLSPDWKLSYFTGPEYSGLKNKSCQLNNEQLNFNCNLLKIIIIKTHRNAWAAFSFYRPCAFSSVCHHTSIFAILLKICPESQSRYCQRACIRSMPFPLTVVDFIFFLLSFYFFNLFFILMSSLNTIQVMHVNPERLRHAISLPLMS